MGRVSFATKLRTKRMDKHLKQAYKKRKTNKKKKRRSKPWKIKPRNIYLLDPK